VKLLQPKLVVPALVIGAIVVWFGACEYQLDREAEFVIRRAAHVQITARCSDVEGWKRLDAEGLEGGLFSVGPARLMDCRFSNGFHHWRYDLDPAAIHLGSFRAFGFRTDPMDPYLYFLVIGTDLKLNASSSTEAVGFGRETGAPPLPGFPLAAVEVSSSNLPSR
jgi:hypothetical protein